jgi:hypothetical protein
MTFAFAVYLASILETVSSFFLTVCFCTGIAGVAVIFYQTLQVCDGTSRMKLKAPAWLLSGAFIFGALYAILPSEKQAYAILAAYGAQQIVQSDDAKQLGNKALILMNQTLDNAINNTKPQKAGVQP